MKFLKEQLDSLYAQEGVDFHILVRDDESRDDTVNLLRKYHSEKGKMTILEGKNVGAARSFYALIKHAVEKMPHYDYYALCDQDDVWYPNKLRRAVDCLAPSDNPLKMYFSMANLSDAENNIIGKTSVPRIIGYKTVFFSNPALGCTQVISYELLKFGLDVPYITDFSTKSQRALLHDAWLYDIASYTDAFMICDDQPSMNYRQHGNNVTTYKKSLINKYKLVIKNIKKYNNARFQEALLLRTYKDLYNKQKRDYLEIFCSYRENWFNTIRCATKADLKSRSFVDGVIFRIMILCRFF